MVRNSTTISVLILLAAICTYGSGCGPRPPIPFQTLQIQDAEEAEGYDVYLYVSIIRGKDYTPAEIEELLKWFDEVKYPTVNRMAVFVWDNPQAALMGISGDLVGSLNVDREAGIFELRIPE